MRDAHLLKEKLQLSLDNRQVVSLVIGALVVLGAVFGLGVTVGKKLGAAAAAAEGPADPLSDVDQKSAALDAARDLTFPEALTRKADVRSQAHGGGASQESKAKPRTVLVPTQTATAEPAARGQAPEGVAAKAPATTPAAAPEAPALEDTATEPPLPEPTPAPGASLAAAFDKVKTQRPGEGGRSAAGSPQASAGDGEFTVQVAASPERSEADGLAARLKALGYSPFIVDAVVPGKGRFFRVRLGRFASRQEAERYLSDFKRETRMEAFVTSAR